MLKHKYKAGTILREHTDGGLFIVQILGTDILTKDYKYTVLVSPDSDVEGLVDSFPIEVLDGSSKIEVLSKNWKLLYGR